MDRQTGEHFNKIKGKRMVKRKKYIYGTAGILELMKKKYMVLNRKKSLSYHSISHEHWSE